MTLDTHLSALWSRRPGCGTWSWSKREQLDGSKAKTESTSPDAGKGYVSVEQTRQMKEEKKKEKKKKEKHRVEKDDGNRAV